MRKISIFSFIFLTFISVAYSQSTITLSSPNSSSTWYICVPLTPFDIKWNKEGLMNDRVKISLLSESGVLVKFLTTSTPNDGEFIWYGGSQKIGPGRYKIRVKTLDNRIEDISDQFIAMHPAVTPGVEGGSAFCSPSDFCIKNITFSPKSRHNLIPYNGKPVTIYASVEVKWNRILPDYGITCRPELRFLSLDSRSSMMVRPNTFSIPKFNLQGKAFVRVSFKIPGRLPDGTKLLGTFALTGLVSGCDSTNSNNSKSFQIILKKTTVIGIKKSI